MADDVRIAQWDLRASAGTTVRLVFTADQTLTSLAVYTGGTTTDVDDLTDATAHTATLSTTTAANDTATVDVDVPTGNSVALRLVVNSVVISVGRLTPSTTGTASPDNTISLAPATYSFTLTIPGIVGGGGGGGISDGDKGDVTVSASGATWTIDPLAVTTGKIADGAVTAAKVAADVATQAELDAEAVLARNADNLTSGTVADARIASTIARDSEVAAAYQALSGKGAAGGYAELDGTGKVPAAQLPSYVDDVVEAVNFAALPATGETGKIYVTLDDNKTYRWSGSAYAEISASLALGETSTTAYRGDRGKTAYDHSQLVTGNPHAVTKADVGLGSVDNTSDASKPVSTATQAALDLKAPLASPTFTGTPAAPTPTAGDNTTKVATTAFVKTATDALSGAYAPLASPAFTGTPTLSGAPLPGAELGYSERITDFTTTNTSIGSTAGTAKPGLSIASITGKGLPVDIEFFAPHAKHSTANVGVVAYLLVNGALDQFVLVSSPSTATGEGIYLKRRMLLTNGVSYTFEIGIAGMAAGTVTVYSGSATTPKHLAVTQR